jgi:hypothetical protein
MRVAGGIASVVITLLTLVCNAIVKNLRQRQYPAPFFVAGLAEEESLEITLKGYKVYKAALSSTDADLENLANVAWFLYENPDSGITHQGGEIHEQGGSLRWLLRVEEDHVKWYKEKTDQKSEYELDVIVTPRLRRKICKHFNWDSGTIERSIDRVLENVRSHLNLDAKPDHLELLATPPGHGPQRWHADATVNLLAGSIPLVDTCSTELLDYPGCDITSLDNDSYTQSNYWSAIWNASLGENAPVRRAEVTRGDFFVHDAVHLHRGPKNTSGKWRYILFFAFPATDVDGNRVFSDETFVDFLGKHQLLNDELKKYLRGK